MSIAHKTYEVYKQFGVLDGIKKISTIRNHEDATWELWALFHSHETGYKNGRIAQFDDVNDAVVFRNLVMAG